MALIGRRRELAELQHLLDRAAAGSGGVLVLAGPDGSGRTALANAAAQAIEMLAAAAGRVPTGQTAVLVTTTVPLGVGPELWLDPLPPAEMGAVTGERRPPLRHALWAASHGLPGPALALAAALARASSDLVLERRGLFWRFVALMELGRVSEAESALAAFEREARAAGDAAGLMMVTARHAMLATVRGRFADASALIGQVAEQGRQAALADTDRLVGTLRGAVAMTRGDPSGLELGVAELRAFARRVPGHFHDATIARILLAAGQTAEAGLELQRALPRVLAGSGPSGHQLPAGQAR